MNTGEKPSDSGTSSKASDVNGGNVSGNTLVDGTKNAGKAESADTPNSMKGTTEPGVSTSMSDAAKNSDDNEMADIEDQGSINPELQGDVEEEDDFEDFGDDDTGPNALQLYNPSSMLSWGQFDVKFFQQLYTQTATYDADGNTIESSARANYYSGIGNFLLGYNNRLNFGFDFWLQSVFIDTEKGSPFRTFSGNRGDFGRTALTAIGPKVKWQPFASANNFTVQSSWLLPVAKDPQGRDNGRPFLATENHLWWTQIFYTNNISDDFQFFGEIDLYWNIDRRFDFGNSGFLAAPMSVFLSYFPTSKITLYVNNQFWPNLGENVVSSWWYQAGFGGKYQLTSSIDLEASVGKFLAGRGTAGPATTMNLGVRFVKF